MTTDGYVQLAPDSTGKKVATQEEVRPDSSVVEQQEVIIAAYSDNSLHELLEQLILEIQDLKWKLIEALQ